MKDVKALAVTAIAVTAASTVLFFAAVGAIFLLSVNAMPTDSNTCDEVRNIDGRPWCLAEARPNEAIRIVRTELK